MAKLTIGQKAVRVVQLLLGLRNRRVAASLKRYGFTQDDLLRGWALLQALTNNRLSVTVGNDPKIIAELDEWENHWFPIVEVVLRTNAPEAHAMMFKNLSQTEGPEVIVSVSTFLTRLALLPKSKDEGGLGTPGRKARELLTKRGLDEEAVGAARKLLDRVGQVAPLDAAEIDATQGDDEVLERELWNWYLEWSGIARVAITDRRLLRGMGFLRPDGRGGEEEEPTDPGITPTPVTPGPAEDDSENEE